MTLDRTTVIRMDIEQPGQLTGLKLGERYLLEDYLGSGSFGAVYRARDLKLDKAVAIKLGHLGVVRDKDFAGEARRASQISDVKGHVVQVFDYGTEGSWSYLVMELLAGTGLDVFIQDLPANRRVAITREFVKQIGEALHQAHQRNLVHRDLKPSNVFVIPKGFDADTGQERYHFVLLDFGISAKINDASQTMQNMTYRGLGTIDYMAPEHLCGQEEPGKEFLVDIYAFGVMLYQLLTGAIPFPMKTHSNLLLALRESEAAKRRKPLSLRAVMPDADVPPAVEALIFKCLEYSPSKRPQSIHDVVQEFLTALPAPTSLSRSVPKESPAGRGWRRVIVGGLLVALAGGAMAYPEIRDRFLLPASAPSETPGIPPHVQALFRQLPTDHHLECGSTVQAVGALEYPLQITITVPGVLDPVTLHLIVCDTESLARSRSALPEELNATLTGDHFPQSSYYLSEKRVSLSFLRAFVRASPADVAGLFWSKQAVIDLKDQEPPGGQAVTYAEFLEELTDSPEGPAAYVFPWLAKGCVEWIAGQDATLPSAAEWDWACGFTRGPHSDGFSPETVKPFQDMFPGTEMTRTRSKGEEEIPNRAASDYEIKLTELGGGSLAAKMICRVGETSNWPLTFGAWETLHNEVIEAYSAYKDVGFRIVVPIPNSERDE